MLINFLQEAKKQLANQRRINTRIFHKKFHYWIECKGISDVDRLFLLARLAATQLCYQSLLGNTYVTGLCRSLDRKPLHSWHIKLYKETTEARVSKI
ncbi:MAG: hypothetical protein DMG05_21180 [Acidobacteria bacterium]|nr:MAG: hypothetical protein DMG05_21180 [Acidobacteriota bacterium]